LRGCKDLGATINELLDITRVEAGQLRLEIGPVDLSAVIDNALRGLRPRFDAAQVRLRIVRDGGAAVVQGDGARLGNVVTNFLTNALKYSPRGSTVTVRTAPGPNAGKGPALVQLEVTDEGPGVPAELRERVFEKFFRVEHQVGSLNRPRGTGIGLYLCREIVKAHGGSIRCEAGANGTGTRMVVLLPVAPAGS
jgi:NtrC-family two-component system sensor histidine kinase KinB